MHRRLDDDLPVLWVCVYYTFVSNDKIVQPPRTDKCSKNVNKKQWHASIDNQKCAREFLLLWTLKKKMAKRVPVSAERHSVTNMCVHIMRARVWAYNWLRFQLDIVVWCTLDNVEAFPINSYDRLTVPSCSIIKIKSNCIWTIARLCVQLECNRCAQAHAFTRSILNNLNKQNIVLFNRIY